MTQPGRAAVLELEATWVWSCAASQQTPKVHTLTVSLLTLLSTALVPGAPPSKRHAAPPDLPNVIWPAAWPPQEALTPWGTSAVHRNTWGFAMVT